MTVSSFGVHWRLPELWMVDSICSKLLLFNELTHAWGPLARHSCYLGPGNMTPPADLFYQMAHRKLNCCAVRFKDAPQTPAASVSETLRTTCSVARVTQLGLQLS